MQWHQPSPPPGLWVSCRQLRIGAQAERNFSGVPLSKQRLANCAATDFAEQTTVQRVAGAFLPSILYQSSWQRSRRAQKTNEDYFSVLVFSAVERWKESRRLSESYSNYGSWLEHRGVSRFFRDNQSLSYGGDTHRGRIFAGSL